MSIFRKKSLDHIMAEAKAGLDDGHGHSGLHLKRTLNVRDLTALGVAAVIGAGIFSTIGYASSQGGPSVALLFILTAITCGFTAFCYAEFASAIPISGSAYTYAYVAFGELVAWLIGWCLILEYAVSNMAVAISWSSYFTEMLKVFGLHIPEWMTIDYFSARSGYAAVEKLLAEGKALSSLTPALQEAYNAWLSAPMLGSFRVIADLPTLLIVFLITWLVYAGIKESKMANNIMVVIKVGVVLLVITVGAFFINPDNWTPFFPHGFGGMMAGVSAVFFAFIGFDAVSTTAEECENPQRDLPRAMIYSLLICTVLYVCIALVLTGMVIYSSFAGVGDPLAFVFSQVNMSPYWLKLLTLIISVSAVVAMASALLAYQIGQPRIWMSMSRDGLLPKIFSRLHPKRLTPSFSTILTGFVVGVPCLFFNLGEVTDLTSMGTLFAFMLVCGGVLRLQSMPGGNPLKPSFRVPYINARYYVPLGFAVTMAIVWLYSPNEILNLIGLGDGKLSLGRVLYEKFPVYLFTIVAIYISIMAWRKNLSLIPTLGMLSCLYMMTSLHLINWERFALWLVIGCSIYFAYSYRNSKLHKATA